MLVAEVIDENRVGEAAFVDATIQFNTGKSR